MAVVGGAPSMAVVLLACLVVQIGFGGYGIVLKKFAEGASANAVVFSFFRDGCCFPVLLIAAALIEGGCKFPKSAKELAVFCGLGVTGMWGNQLFYILGLYYTSATVASCWQPAIPVFAAFFAIILGVEPFPPLAKCRGWLKLLGILCAAGGALVLTLGKPDTGTGTSDGSTSAALGTECDGITNQTELCLCHKHENGKSHAASQASLGNIFLLLNCSCMALYINIQKVFIFRNDKEPEAVGSIWKPNPVHITAWSYFFGALAMIITAVLGNILKVEFLGFGSLDKNCDTNHPFDVPKPMFVGLVYAVFISSALCYGLITFANKHLPATVVTAFWPVQVPVAVVLASCPVGIFAKESDSDGSGSDAVGPFCETLTTMELLGGVLIALGLISVTVADNMERKETEALKSSGLGKALLGGEGSINYDGLR